jgi:hypothetical protein
MTLRLITEDTPRQARDLEPLDLEETERAALIAIREVERALLQERLAGETRSSAHYLGAVESFCDALARRVES